MKTMSECTVAQLLALWELSDDKPIVRGMIMTELENRDQDAYIAWMEDEPNASPRKYFKA